MNSPEGKRRRPWRKCILSLFVLLGAVAIMEVSVRIYYAGRVGRNVLFYGTRWHRQEVSGKEQANTSRHANRIDTYTKYFPNQELRDYDRETGEGFEVTINSRGFRGADWDEAKVPGVVRVVVLGASSTFGYSDRDDQTYPVYLEAELEARDPQGREFEVINLGIPHLESDQILALFLNEGLPLGPDVVTFYEGVNDASSQDSPVILAARGTEGVRRANFLRPLIDATKNRSMLASMLDHRFPVRIERFSRADCEQHAGLISVKFLENLQLIHAAAEEVGARFVPATQQAKSRLIPRESMRDVTYAQEVEVVRAKLEETQGLTPSEFYFLTHDVIMARVRDWAAREGLPLVDGISALDADRRVLVSWVHLNARGNRELAKAFAEAILVSLD